MWDKSTIDCYILIQKPECQQFRKQHQIPTENYFAAPNGRTNGKDRTIRPQITSLVARRGIILKSRGEPKMKTPGQGIL